MNKMNETQNEIYNNIIHYLKIIQIEKTKARWWIYGYLGGLMDIGKITGIEACKISLKIEDVLDEIIKD